MRYITTIVTLLIFGIVFAAPPKVISTLTGKVIGVTDGDTIKVLVNRQSVIVRLEGIDAPESSQSFGTKSKQALSTIVLGKTVTVKKTGEDRYGRTLGIIMVGDLDANEKMIQDGWAWHYKKYNDEERLAKLELSARQAKRGLWTDSNPLPPWEYRARKKSPNNTPATMFWLNTSSNVRHNENCEYFKNTKRGRSCGPNDGKACGRCGG
jgi:endonuclease YncB( thermonuclease family)|tara:strand:+ start:1364 stop:1990 length:627 start_codon:yes stop_codon:yes gene_type:complete